MTASQQMSVHAGSRNAVRDLECGVEQQARNADAAR
jgi:hypothetical protein